MEFVCDFWANMTINVNYDGFFFGVWTLKTKTLINNFVDLDINIKSNQACLDCHDFSQ